MVISDLELDAGIGSVVGNSAAAGIGGDHNDLFVAGLGLRLNF